MSVDGPNGLYILIRYPDGSSHREQVSEQRYGIGRIHDSDIHLPSPAVSRRHAEIRREDDGTWVVEDLGSRNGTRVGEQQISRHELKVGDVIAIADFVLEWRDDTAAASELTSAGTKLTTEQEPDVEELISLKDVPSPHVDASHLGRLVEFGRGLLTTEQPLDRLQALCEMMTSGEFPGRLAMIVDVPDGDSDTVCICGPVLRQGWQPPDRYLSHAVLNAVHDRQQSVLGTNVRSTRHDNDVMMSIDMSSMGAAVMACPLGGDDRHTRVLYTLTAAEYGTSEWLAVADLAAEQFATSERVWQQKLDIQRRAALQRDVESARQLQQNLLPMSVDIARLQTSLRFEPSREVAGDYVDIVPLPDGRVVLAVADVRGKGMPAAMVASSIHSILRASLSSDVDLFDTFNALNTYLHGVLPMGHFVTMVGLTLDPQTGDCRAVQAGHPPVLAVCPGGFRELQAADTFALGLVPNLELTPVDETLAPQEALALYSDGITETIANDGKWLGHRRLAAMLAEAMKPPGSATLGDISSALFDQLDRLARPEHDEDDRVLLLVRRAAD